MHRIDSANALPGGTFTEGDPMVPVPATEVSADWLNAVQEEFVSVIQEAGIALSKTDNSQLLASLVKLGMRAATTEARGLVELATHAEAATLTDAERAVTPGTLGYLFSRSLSASGYQRLPGGLIVQWGEYAGSGCFSITFPVSFPNSCLVTIANAFVQNSDGGDIVEISSKSKYKFSGLLTDTSRNTTVSSGAMWWLAVGY